MIKFSEIPYSRPDMGEVKEELSRLTKEFERADTYEKARDAFIREDALSRHIMSVSTLAHIRHSIDTRDSFYGEEEKYWNRAYPELQEYLDKWTRALCGSKFRSALSEEFC